ncbi:MAG: EAL domain-containing protein [Alphaproteobacteria bacterium]|nr:MAG: EAL domain-containing protein [Alphaproteobacteria bacterium]
MHGLPHLAFFLSYVALAGALGVYAPRWWPTLSQGEAFGLGGLVLLGGALLHEVLARLHAAAVWRNRLFEVVQAYGDQQEDLAWLRREVQAIREALDAASQSDGLGGGRVEEMMAEVRVMRTLLERLSARPAPGRDGGHGDGGPASRRVPVPRAQSPSTDDTGDAAASVPALKKRDAMLEAVREALRNDRIDLVLQPIVTLPQRRRRFYECFSRLRRDDGTVILPDQYIAVAERAGLIATIDNMLLFRCVQLIRKVQRKSQDVDFFCNVSPHTLADAAFFNDFIAFLEGNRTLAEHLVFEFAQADFTRLDAVGGRLFDRLAALGCRFSIDQVRDPDIDVGALAQRGIRFIKIEADRLLAILSDNVSLVRACQRHRIDLIVEKVEDESRLVELLDFEIPFGQGYLFGAPRLARPAA